MIPKNNFKDLSFNISNFCLSSCKYCRLCSPSKWGLDEEMPLSLIERTLKDPVLDNLVTIHLTGGEPFLSPKFLPIIDILSRRFHIVPVNLPTNALFPRLIERIMRIVMNKTPQLVLNIGFEGPNKEIHESVRGKGSWEPMMETIKLLRPLETRMKLNMTVWKENYPFITDTYWLAQDMGLPFYLNFGRYSMRFGNEKDAIRWYGETPEENERILNDIEEQIDRIGWKDWRPLNRQKWALQKAKWEGKKVRWSCLAGIEGIDLFPDGEVYPCLQYFKEYSFGNLKESSSERPLSEIMERPSSLELQKRIYAGECSEKCPFTCALRIRNPIIEERR